MLLCSENTKENLVGHHICIFVWLDINYGVFRGVVFPVLVVVGGEEMRI